MRSLRKYLPFFIIPVSVGLALLFVGGCSSSTSVSTNDGTVTMQSQLTSTSTQLPYTGKNPSPTSVIQSVTVTQVEVFIKDIKLHQEKDSANKDDRNIKTGPMVVVFDSLGSHVFATSTIPAGTYEKIKFEMHHPNRGDAADSAFLAQYPDFVSGNKTFTIVIKGYTTSLTGVKTSFMARSEKSHNYELKFKDKDNIVVTGGGTSLLTLLFDPTIVFHVNGGLGLLFDPNDTTYQNEIDNNVQISLSVKN
jgi:hypothetical protein